MTKTQIQEALSQRGLRPLKQLGQNFLYDQNLCRILVKEAVVDLNIGEKILEIGPGLGALTHYFLEEGFPVTALEKDRGLAQFLREKFQDQKSFQLIEGDALITLPELKETFSHVAGNLPYNISSQLLMTLLDFPVSPQRMVFTLQRELAERIASKPGVKNYGILSVLVQAEYEVDIFRYLPASVFFPAPEVDSAALRLKKRKLAPFNSIEKMRFREWVKKGFSQRRKKLSNLLPISDSRRAEELSVEEWIALSRGEK